MRIVRFVTSEGPRYGVLEDKLIYNIKGNPFDQFKGPGSTFQFDGSTCKLNEVKLLAPCTPTKIVGVGLNHRAHGDEQPIPPLPVIFIKPSTAVIGTEENIILPEHGQHVGFELELGVVIGRTAKAIPEKEANNYIMGYTCINDVSDYDILGEDRRALTRGKGFDTYAPMGPWIETDLDPGNLKMETRLNGEIRQADSTSGYMRSAAYLLNFISEVMTLLPGDVLSIGTPAGSGTMKPGDVLEMTIENIGTLKNFVVSKKRQVV